MTGEVILKVGGKKYGGWTGLEATRGLDSLHGGFQVSLSERWPGQPDQWGIAAGDACQLLIGDELIMTGWVDHAALAMSADRHPVTVRGRERTCDLVDCSALHKPGSWKGRKIEQIAGELTAPFGIKASATAPTGGAFGKFALQQGETVFGAIDRILAIGAQSAAIVWWAAGINSRVAAIEHQMREVRDSAGTLARLDERTAAIRGDTARIHDRIEALERRR